VVDTRLQVPEEGLRRVLHDERAAIIFKVACALLLLRGVGQLGVQLLCDG